MPHLPYLEAPERAFSLFGEREIFREETVIADDGVPLTVLEAGDSTKLTVLLVNALGVSCLFLTRLAARLARDYHVLTWESRGLPDFDALPANADLSVERHCADAVRILAHKDRKPTAIVAYCSGANVAVYATVNRIVDADRICIVSPSMELKTVTARTDYQRTMLPIWEKMSQSGPRYAALVRALIQQNRKPHDGTLESELSVVNNLPFRTDNSTHRYAQLQAACLKFDWADLLGKLNRPLLVLHGADDDLIHVETSAAVSAGVAGAAFHVIPNCGHFAIFTTSALHESIAAFLGGREDCGIDKIME